MILPNYVQKQLERISEAKTPAQKQDALYRLASHTEALSSDRLYQTCKGDSFTDVESQRIVRLGSVILSGHLAEGRSP